MLMLTSRVFSLAYANVMFMLVLMLMSEATNIFGLGRLKKTIGSPAGHPALLFGAQRCGNAGD